MTKRERLQALQDVQRQLWDLMTDDEQHDYPVLDHLHDLIEDLKTDHRGLQPPLTSRLATRRFDSCTGHITRKTTHDHHHLPGGDGAGPDHHPLGDPVAPVPDQATKRPTARVQRLDLDTHQQPLRRLPNHSEALGYGITLPQSAYL